MFEAKIYLLPIVGYAVRGESYAGHRAMASYSVRLFSMLSLFVNCNILHVLMPCFPVGNRLIQG